MNGLTIKIFVIAFCVFLLTDFIWIGWIAKSFYLKQYGPWLRLAGGQLQPIWWAALFIYFLFALSVVVFIAPLAQGSLFYAAVYGAVLGAVIYGIYDLTCIALFKNFPISAGLIDWLWGIVLCSWSAFFTFYLARFLK